MNSLISLDKSTLIQAIPSVITLGNLLLGFFSIILAINGEYRWVVSLIIICMFLDFLDGKAARWLDVASPFGKELDSLSDIVSFGVAPAVLTFMILPYHFYWVVLNLILFLVCGACRLARFNVEGKNQNQFTGFPITTAGGLLALVSYYNNILPPVILFTIIITLSIQMVGCVPFSSLKGSNIQQSHYFKLLSLTFVFLSGVVSILYPFIMAIVLGIYYLSGPVLYFPIVYKKHSQHLLQLARLKF
ncbi:CDP-diacylglycerol--serine O-phosphatidyltransferase [Natranaerobius trueperi]|uniref:CDP-diacylglycerol--serine O-phosphatidyltransferase n=1 Tax=Natranaerobius trueperi TaxID=759412 RepID=UPI0013030ADD|nr:CDP-diacylglycerol--serine O-phosphatidyltransferase [Natranaerobius trueperi]